MTAMPVALILSSFVAASRIGGAAQQYVLAAHKIDPVLAPTVMFGRSPALGGQGEVTSPEVFRRMLADIEADATFGLVDLVITGHFSSPEQVEIAAAMLERIQAAAGPAPIVIVDPILGDAPKGLYVSAGVARAVADRLVPLSDWITPNLWELGHLAGADLGDAAATVAAARKLGKPALVTSAPAHADEIGMLFVEAGAATLFAHPRLPRTARAQRNRRPGDRQLRRRTGRGARARRRRRTRRPRGVRSRPGRPAGPLRRTADRRLGTTAGAPHRALAYPAPLTKTPGGTKTPRRPLGSTGREGSNAEGC